jgi:hypothetical protein
MNGYYERLEQALAGAVPRRKEILARSARRRRLGGAALGSAAAGAGLCIAVLLGTAGGTAPAYALSVRADGSVVLSVRELLGVAPANARLARLGVPARLVRRETGCAANVRGTILPPWMLARDLRSLPSHLTRTPLDKRLELEAERVRAELRFLRNIVGGPTGASGKFEVVIRPSAIPAGYTLVLAFRALRSTGRVSPGGPTRSDHAIGGSVELVKGAAPSCLSFESPAIQRVAR